MYCSAGSIPATSTNLKLNKMSEIIKGQVSVDRSVYTEFSKQQGFFLICADVWSVVSEVTDVTFKGKPVYDHDITEIHTRFRIDGRPVKQAGFEELYVKLYGCGAYAKLVLEWEQEVEKAYYATTEYTVHL